jgi:hypothetical protein
MGTPRCLQHHTAPNCGKPTQKHKQPMINGAQWEQNCGKTKEGERAQLPGKQQQQQQQRRINVKYERNS